MPLTVPELKPEDVEMFKNPFTDVEEGRYFYDPVLCAVENGITAGMTPTTFAPDSNCTRGQVFTLNTW